MGTPLIQVESPRQWPLRTLFYRRFEEAVMSKGQPSDGARGNRLLGAMEAASRARIAPHLEPLVLKLGDVVCEAGGVLKHAYFPQSAVLSLLTVLENGSAIETANIGREGAFGLFAAMYSRVSFNRCLVQFEGGMVRCPIDFLRRNSSTANTSAICLSAIPRRCSRRFSRPSPAMRCIRQKRECADGC